MNYFPKVYIVILNYKGWWDTIECLESVLRINYPNYQVIVVDNNSPNNSMEYIRDWAEGKIEVWVNPKNPLRKYTFPPIKKPISYVYYQQEEAEQGGNSDKENNSIYKLSENNTSKYPVIFIQSRENLGFAAGNNIAIRYALSKNDFKYILLLNNDTVVNPNFLSRLIEISERENLGLSGCKIHYYHEPKNIWYNGGKFYKWICKTTHIQNENTTDFSESSFITGCCMLIRKDVLEKVGLLDESYFMYVEDLDFSYKVAKSGDKLGVVHKSVIYHKVGSSSGEEITPFSAYWMMRNRIRFIRKSLKKIQQITSLGFIFLSRGFMYLYWSSNIKKYKDIIKAQLKGIKDAFLLKE